MAGKMKKEEGCGLIRNGRIAQKGQNLVVAGKMKREEGSGPIRNGRIAQKVRT
jgi:hypothetical protein